MSAGRGISHSEMNGSDSQAGALPLQIWIVPGKLGVDPGYQQQALDPAPLRAGFTRIVAPEGEKALFRIYQDARLDVASAGGGAEPAPGARARAQALFARGQRGGAVRAGGQELRDGDALMLEQETVLELTVGTGCGAAVV